MPYRTELWRRRLVKQPRRTVRRWLRALWPSFRRGDTQGLLKRVARLEQNQHNLVFALYADVGADVDQRTALRTAEIQSLCQNGEAGVLLHIFSRIGVTDRRFVEFGVGQVTKCNSTHLVANFGWSGLLIDGQRALLEQARRFHAERSHGDPPRIQLVECWLTPQNINQVLGDHGFVGEIDLLSVDVDGNDYWLWKAIEVINPRVVVAEYNASFGADDVLIAKYDPKFDRHLRHPFGWYHGASLPAMERLGGEKGYRLVGCESSGLNAFFVREDVAQGRFEALTAQEAFYPDVRRLRVASLEEQLESVRHLPFERGD